MALTGRGSRPAQGPVPRLVLPDPSRAPEPAPASRWRAVIAEGTSDAAAETVMTTLKPAAMASRAEKQLVQALVADDVARLSDLAGSGGDVHATANILLGLRLADQQPDLAAHALRVVIATGKDPADQKFLRRYLPTLAVPVGIAPGVRAVLPIDAESIVLLLAELLTSQARPVDAVSLLESQPPTPMSTLALAAAELTIGHNDSVVSLTEGVPNVDDLSALCLVARGVALRTVGRLQDAITAFDRALEDPNRAPGMVAAALSERAEVLRMTGDPLAAQADEERIQEICGVRVAGNGGVGETSAPVPAPSAQAPILGRPLERGTEETADQEAVAAARARVRRRLRGTKHPGTFGGRHHSTYREEVAAILATDQYDTAVNLLLGLLDAVEDEADEIHAPIDPTYYLTLADVFAAHREVVAEFAVLERFAITCRRTHTDPGDVSERLRRVAGAVGVSPPAMSTASSSPPSSNSSSSSVA